MSKRAAERRNERIAQGLCIYCGERPQFWGRKCIICRQVFAKDPLPSGAKRALRLHREAEARRLQEKVEKDARKAVLNLLESQEVQGKQAEALRLYAGIDNWKWRTYDEVGQLMKISRERVRQLLLPSKLTLSLTLSDRVPWQPLERIKSNRTGKMDPSLSTACTLCNNIALKILDHEFYLYEGCGLPNVVLSGLTLDQCQNCNTETVWIDNRTGVPQIWTAPVTVSGAGLRNGSPDIEGMLDVLSRNFDTCGVEPAGCLVDSFIRPRPRRVYILSKFFSPT